MSQEAAKRSKRWARLYRELGFNPLPSRGDAKIPDLPTYSSVRDNGISDEILDKWSSPNIQIATGARWNFCVIDIDGPKALGEWERLSRIHNFPRTWEVERCRVRRHIWYRTPPGVDFIPYRQLRAIGNDKIELLGDGRLVVAPPSKHAKTGEEYRFLRGMDGTQMAVLPELLWDISKEIKKARLRNFNTGEPRGHRYNGGLDFSKIGQAEKIEIAKKCGVVFARKFPNNKGWIPCHRDKNDKNPSASFNVNSGVLWCANWERSHSLWEVVINSGLFKSDSEALNFLKGYIR